jgi:carboxymethylenebutenolidase
VAAAPTVVLLHEWWGLNDHVRSLVDRLASSGFIALAPDLYDGTVARDPTEAQRLMNALQWPAALDVIAGAVSFLKSHPRANGRVGVTGFCMGGAGTFATACNVPGVSAAVVFYGLAPASYTPWESADVPPLQAHFSSRDAWAKADAAAAIRDRLVARGRSLDLHVYDAEHAFVNDTRPEVYHPEHARVAWQRMLGFFQKHLG